jgi:hypothetical protein
MAAKKQSQPKVTTDKLDRLKVARIITQALDGALEQLSHAAKQGSHDAVAAHAHAQAAQVMLDAVAKGQHILYCDRNMK